MKTCLTLGARAADTCWQGTRAAVTPDAADANVKL